MTVTSPVDRPSSRPVVSTSERQQIVVLAADAAALNQVATKLPHLRSLGHRVVLVWLSGKPGRALASFKARVPIRTFSSRGRRQQARLILTTPPRYLRDRASLAGALALDPRATRTLRSADAVVPVGQEAWKVAERLMTREHTLVTADELDQWAQMGALWNELQRRLDDQPGRLDPKYTRRLLRHITLMDGVPLTRQSLLIPPVEALHATGEYDLARRLLAFVSMDHDGLDEIERTLRRGLAVLVQTSAEGEEQAELRPAAGQLVDAADRCLDLGETDRAVSAATLALQLLFHRELHADGTSSPLVGDADNYLAPWRASRVGRLLEGPAPQRPVVRRNVHVPSRDTHRPRVVVVPGTYSSFARPVIEALKEKAEVRVVELSARPELRGLGTRRELVDARLRQALGSEDVPSYELLEELEQADALFVDWADRGGLAAVMTAPEGIRVVLRVHSMDAFSPWIHLIDWSRVDELILVSEHLRQMVTRLVGDRLTHTRVHVVSNVLDESRLPTTRTEGYLRRMLMVGWGQRVKDPLWALEVLAALRVDEPAWRLSLVGADFPADAIRSQGAYARQFRERLTHDDVRGAIDFVGFTRDLAPHLARSGFMLSTSRRESFGLGLVEGAAAGLVPVVRNWPVFAPLDGARTLFPDDWVVESIDEAVERIRAHAEEPAWGQASAAARVTVRQRFQNSTARATFQDLVLGPDRPAVSGSR